MLNIENYPSVINNHGAAPDVSSRYKFVPTTSVLEVLADYGWFPSVVSEAKVRNEEKRGFQKHVIRLKHEKYVQLIKNREYFPELIVKNAHDRSGVFEFMMGLWRLVCSNGMCAPFTYGHESIRHVGFATEKVEAAIKELAFNAPKLITSVESFQSIQLTKVEQVTYARAALELKHDPEDDTFKIDPRDINYPRRSADYKDDLWTTFNRVQENLIKGGVGGKTPKNRWRRDRAVNSIERNLSLNRALWTLTEEMAKLKGQAVN